VHELRLAFYADAVLPGGCFFAAAGPEFDDRPGPVRERIADAMAAYHGLLVTLARRAVEVGHLRPDADPELLAFEMQACEDAVIRHTRLLGSAHAVEFARRAVLDRLRSLAVDPSLLPQS
jgi:hypothetical protein